MCVCTVPLRNVSAVTHKLIPENNLSAMRMTALPRHGQAVNGGRRKLWMVNVMLVGNRIDDAACHRVAAEADALERHTGRLSAAQALVDYLALDLTAHGDAHEAEVRRLMQQIEDSDHLIIVPYVTSCHRVIAQTSEWWGRLSLHACHC